MARCTCHRTPRRASVAHVGLGLDPERERRVEWEVVGNEAVAARELLGVRPDRTARVGCSWIGEVRLRGASSVLSNRLNPRPEPFGSTDVSLSSRAISAPDFLFGTFVHSGGRLQQRLFYLGCRWRCRALRAAAAIPTIRATMPTANQLPEPLVTGLQFDIHRIGRRCTASTPCSNQRTPRPVSAMPTTSRVRFRPFTGGPLLAPLGVARQREPLRVVPVPDNGGTGRRCLPRSLRS